jgi:hypothetical protein
MIGDVILALFGAVIGVVVVGLLIAVIFGGDR